MARSKLPPPGRRRNFPLVGRSRSLLAVVLGRSGPAAGPGAGYPAAGPGAGCRLPGRPFFPVTVFSFLHFFDILNIFLGGGDFILIPGVRRAIFGIYLESFSEKWPARQPAAGTGPGSRVAGTRPG